MRAALTAFQAMDVDPSDLQVDLIPAQRHELADAQAVPIGQEDHGRVPVPVAPQSPRCRCEPLNFVGRQIRSDWRGHAREIHHCPGFSGLFSVGETAFLAEMLISSPPTVHKMVISGTVST
jgi:hypothetical protein